MGMVAAIDATRTGDAQSRCLQVEDARVPADLRVAGDGRRAALHGGQQRHRRRLRSEDRRAAVDQDARHAAEGIAGARRRQAVCRHRERQVLHPAAVGDRASRCSTRTCSAPPQSRRRSSPRRSSPTAASTWRRWTTLYAIGTRKAGAGRRRAGRDAAAHRTGAGGAPSQVFPYDVAARARGEAELHASGCSMPGARWFARSRPAPRPGRSIRWRARSTRRASSPPATATRPGSSRRPSAA